MENPDKNVNTERRKIHPQEVQTPDHSHLKLVLLKSTHKGTQGTGHDLFGPIVSPPEVSTGPKCLSIFVCGAPEF